MDMVADAKFVAQKVATEGIRAVADTAISLQGWQEGVMTEIFYLSGQFPPQECGARARGRLSESAGRECELIATALATYSLRLEDVIPDNGGNQGREKRVRFADDPDVAVVAPKAADEDSVLDVDAMLEAMAPAWRDSISNVMDKPFRAALCSGLTSQLRSKGKRPIAAMVSKMMLALEVEKVLEARVERSRMMQQTEELLSALAAPGHMPAQVDLDSHAEALTKWRRVAAHTARNNRKGSTSSKTHSAKHFQRRGRE